MNEKHYAQMYAALQRIRRYQTPAQIKRDDWGVPYGEALEMSYENIQQEARSGLRGVRKPPTPKPPPMHPVTLTETDIAALCGGKVRR